MPIALLIAIIAALSGTIAAFGVYAYQKLAKKWNLPDTPEIEAAISSVIKILLDAASSTLKATGTKADPTVLQEQGTALLLQKLPHLDPNTASAIVSHSMAAAGLK